MRSIPKQNEERVETLHPGPERKGTRISKAMHDDTREAILDAVPDGEPGLPFADLSREVQERVPKHLLENASVSWYTVTVKLDLEAIGLISRVPGSGPQDLARRR